ncbi:Protein disulfide isomerase-like 5-1 [Bienertia sinuspersici]
MIDFACFSGDYLSLAKKRAFQLIKEKDTAWFVRFCVPWCKHCKNLGSLWEELGKAMEGEDEIEIGQVDCSTSKPVCSSVDIHSYPTFKLFYNGEEVIKYQVETDDELVQPPPSVVNPADSTGDPLTYIVPVVVDGKARAKLSQGELSKQAGGKVGFFSYCSWPRDVESLKTFVLEETEKAASKGEEDVSDKEL